jgi:hypothetical protein
MAEAQDRWQQAVDEAARADDDETPAPRQNTAPQWPQPLKEAAYHGIVGEFVHLIEPHTEADPAALIFQFLAYMGNLFGNRAWYRIEETRHYPNLYVTLVGDTAIARKGTSRKRISRLAQTAAPEWEANCVTTGLSTGEGLIARVRDPIYSTNKKGELELSDPGVKDKRLLVIEEEFSRPLRVMERSNNTLAAVLRQAWDGDRLSNMTKENPMKATDAIVSIIGHITHSELQAELREVQMANGFGNRFLWPLVKRSKSLPFGGADCADGIREIALKLQDALKGCGNGLVRFDEVARRGWAEVYEELTKEQIGLAGVMMARSAPQVIRAALVYALLDHQSMIGAHHLAAGLEIVRYSNDSVRHIFSDKTGNRIVDTILQALRNNPAGLTRAYITRDLFDRNVTADKIAAAIGELIAAGKIRHHAVTTGGRPAEVFVAV